MEHLLIDGVERLEILEDLLVVISQLSAESVSLELLLDALLDLYLESFLVPYYLVEIVYCQVVLGY